jgi:phosphoglycerate kinase
LKKSLKHIDVKDKRVLVRVDFNVPIAQGRVTDDTRLRAALPTIQYLIRHKAKIVLISHLGRPKGVYSPEYSLAPVAKKLSRLIGREVKLCPEAAGSKAKAEVDALNPGNVLLLENVRFYKEES